LARREQRLNTEWEIDGTPKSRKYEYQLSTLIDLLSIVTLKSIKLGVNNPEKKKAYEEEARLIMHDIDLILKEKIKDIKDLGLLIRAVQVNMLANETIWSNETLARQGGSSQNHLLPFTHSVNGMRMRAGNVIAYQVGERKDLNLDRVNDEISRERGYDWSGLFD